MILKLYFILKIKPGLPLLGAQVQPLVRELRSHTPCSAPPKNIKNQKLKNKIKPLHRDSSKARTEATSVQSYL